MAVSFTSVLGAVQGVATKLSEIVNTFNNTRFNKDRINGDDAESTGAGGHDHTASGAGLLIPFTAIVAAIDCQSTVSEAESTDTIGTFTQKLLHSFTPPIAGDYKIEYNFEVTHSVGNGETEVQVDFDAGTIIAFTHEEPEDGDDYQLHSGFDIQTLTAAAHTVEVDFRRASASGTAKIRRARIVTSRCV